MENKKIIKISFFIILLLLLFFIYYRLFIRQFIVGTYIPTSKDCQTAYNCNCVQDNCICTYKKWFKENKMTCSKEILEENQMQH